MVSAGWPTWSQGRVSAVESGDQSLRLVEAADLAALYAASTDDLLTDPLKALKSRVERELADEPGGPDVGELDARHLLRARLAVLTWLDDASLDYRIGDTTALDGCGCVDCPLPLWTPPYTAGCVFFRMTWADQSAIFALLGCRSTRLKRLERAHDAIWNVKRTKLALTLYGTQVLAELEDLHPALSALRRDS